MKRDHKLSNVLARAREIAVTEERRVVVYRDENDQWRLDRYLPEFIRLGNPIRFCILVNAFTGYETITNSEAIVFYMPRRITAEKKVRKVVQRDLPIGKEGKGII